MEYATLEDNNKSKMKIIAIEGLDKSGKHTQTNMLVEHLRNQGFNVVQSEFHRYDTPTGELIMKWLRKEWNVSQTTIELIMAADKQAQQEWFYDLEKNNVDFLVLDRYTMSQFVYSLANDMEKSWVLQLQRFMRKPDLNIFIDIPGEESMKRKGKWGENDRYESDLALLNEVRSLFFWYSKNIVDGMGTPEEVHKDIVELVDGIID
jgi:dTMP kinase